MRTKKNDGVIFDEDEKEVTTKKKRKQNEEENDDEGSQYSDGSLLGNLSDKFYGDPIILEIKDEDQRKFFAVMEKGENNFLLKERVEAGNGEFVLVNLKEIDQKDYKLRFGFEDGFIGSSRKRVIGVRLEKEGEKKNVIIPYISSREYLDIISTMLSSLGVWKKEISIGSGDRIEELKELVEGYESCISNISKRLETMKSNLQEEIESIKNDLLTIEKDVKFRADEIKKLEKEHGSEQELKDARKILVDVTNLQRELVYTVKSYENTIKGISAIKI